VALDFAVINALGVGHWDETFRAPGAAAEAYDARKRSYQDTAAKCEAAGVRFQPIVCEAQGGITKAAGAVLHSIAGAVAIAEDLDPVKIREEMFENISLAIVRANARAIARRRRHATGGMAVLCRQAMAEATLLEEPG
jgi:hypothetical protein